MLVSKQFIIRTCVHGLDNLEPMKFHQHHAADLGTVRGGALGGTQGHDDRAGQRAELGTRGWGTHWKNGTEFAAWWRMIAEVYRREFVGCKIGFPAMSPGDAVAGVRTEEGAFVTQAKAAVAAADWIGASVLAEAGRQRHLLATAELVPVVRE